MAVDVPAADAAAIVVSLGEPVAMLAALGAFALGVVTVKAIA